VSATHSTPGAGLGAMGGIAAGLSSLSPGQQHNSAGGAPATAGHFSSRLPKRSAVRLEKVKAFAALIAKGMTTSAAAKALDIDYSTARQYRAELRRTTGPLRDLGVCKAAQKAMRANRDKADTLYARMAPLLREHLAAERTVASFCKQHHLGHRTVARMAAAHGIQLPKQGPRPVVVEIEVLVPAGSWGHDNVGACSRIIFTRRCQTCGVIFQRAGLQRVTCDGCWSAA
jgi:transposase